MIMRENTPEQGVNNATMNGVSVYFENFVYRENITEMERRAMQYTEYLAGVVGDGNNYMDHGGAARVYTLGQEGGCVKIMKNRHKSSSSFRYDLGVSPLEEFKIMERVHGLEVSGCRAPIAEMCLESGDTSLIVMERLPAIGLQHILNRTENLPEGFDYDAFMKALEDYIDALHKEKKVAHKDLHARNVMVDEESCLPYVIDFGRSVILDGLSDVEIRKQTEDDWTRCDEIFFELEKLRLSERPTLETIPLNHEECIFSGEVHVHYSKDLLQEAVRLLKEKTGDNNEDIVVPFGKKQTLIVSKNEENVRGALVLKVDGVNYFIGRRKNNYLV